MVNRLTPAMREAVLWLEPSGRYRSLMSTVGSKAPPSRNTIRALVDRQIVQKPWSMEHALTFSLSPLGREVRMALDEARRKSDAT